MKKLKYGSIIEYRRCLFVKICGLDADILTDVKTGVWFFIHELQWKKFKIRFVP